MERFLELTSVLSRGRGRIAREPEAMVEGRGAGCSCRAF